MFADGAKAEVVQGLEGWEGAAEDHEDGLGGVPDQEVELELLVRDDRRYYSDKTHRRPCSIHGVRLGEFRGLHGAANTGEHTAGHEQA